MTTRNGEFFQDEVGRLDAQLGSAEKATPGNVVNWIGDSISPSQLGSPGVGNYVSPGVQLSATDFLAWAHWLSNGKILYGNAAGVTGQQAWQMTPRIFADALARGGNFCGITTGTNDASNGRTAAQFAADIRAMCAMIVAAGQTPILCSGVPQPVNSARILHDRYRRFLQGYAIQNGWPFLDYYSLLVDTATGGYLAGYDNGDGIHPNAAGKKVMGQALVDLLSPYLVPFTAVLPTVGDNAQTANLLNNATLTIDTNADGVPDNWTKSGGTVACSLVSDAAVVGKAMRLLDAASGGFTQVNYSVPSVASLQGHRLAFTGLFKNVGTSAFNINLVSNGTGALVARAVNGLTLATPGWQKFYIEVVVPSDATTLTPSFQSGGGPAVDCYFAQPGLYDLTAAGL